MSPSFWRKREEKGQYYYNNIAKMVAHLTNHILHKIVQTHSTLYIVTKIYKSLEEHTNINMSFFAHIERSYKEGVTLNLSVLKGSEREREGGRARCRDRVLLTTKKAPQGTSQGLWKDRSSTFKNMHLLLFIKDLCLHK